LKNKAAGQNLKPVSENLQKLIRLCIANNRTAQKELYHQYAPFLYGVIKRYTYHKVEADEILNDSFYKIFTSLRSFSFKGSFEGWMRRITLNCITDNFRKYIKKEPSHKIDMEQVQDVYINEEVISDMGYKALLKMIYELPETQRTVFNLFVFDQYSHKEIGIQLNITENNSRWHLNDARKRLKEKINEMT